MPSSIDEGREQVERARTKGNGRTIPEQASLVELELERPEAVALGRGNRSHPHSLPAMSPSGPFGKIPNVRSDTDSATVCVSPSDVRR
jgi:hypothetical protein